MKLLLTVFVLLLLVGSVFSAPGDLIWRVYVPNGDNNYSPQVAYGMVYFTSINKNLYALNARTGTHVWSYTLENVAYTPYVSDDGRIYCGINSLVAHNAYTGERIWAYNDGSSKGFSSPLEYQGSVYSGNGNKYFYALNASNGSLKWRFYILAVYTDDILRPCVSEVENLVYFSTRNMDYSLYALDMQTGVQKWKYNLNQPINSPIMSGDKPILCLTTYHNGAWAFNPKYGGILWKGEIPGMIKTAAVYGNGKFYFFAFSGCLYAINENDGKVVWQYGEEEDSFWEACYYDGVVYHNDCYHMYAVNAETGEFLWKYRAYANAMEFTPCAKDGIVYTIDWPFYITALETYGYTGFKETKNTKPLPSSLKAFPNPFRDYLNLKLLDKGAIYNIAGSMIKALGSGNHRLDTNGWKSGTYIIRSGKEEKRIIKID